MNLFLLPYENLVVFPMVFDWNPIYYIPEPTLVQRLLYIKTNDPGIDVGLPATNIRHSQDNCRNL